MANKFMEFRCSNLKCGKLLAMCVKESVVEGKCKGKDCKQKSYFSFGSVYTEEEYMQIKDPLDIIGYFKNHIFKD